MLVTPEMKAHGGAFVSGVYTFIRGIMKNAVMERRERLFKRK